MNPASQFFNNLIDFVFPQECILCSKETARSLVCRTCHEYLPAVHSPVCRTCGRPVRTHDVCAYCRNGSWLDHGRAWLYFIPPVNTLIHHFKYRGKKVLATLLGRAMASIIRADTLLQEADMIVPVPLFWLKHLHRGYNQSTLLCKVISANTMLPQQAALKRTRYTRTQTKLSDAARHKNIEDAFLPRSDDIKDKKVILIDDVLTTGATMNECARILKQAGATAVYSCVAAITP